MNTKIKTTLKIVLVIIAVIVSYFLCIILGFVLIRTGEYLDDTKFQLGDGYYLTAFDNGLFLKNKTTLNVGLIDEDIFAWNFDSIFIIAVQKPYYLIMDSLDNKYPNMKYAERRKAYNEVLIFHYWIIDKREELGWNRIDKDTEIMIKNGIFGPFTYKEYLKKRKELNVPDSLQLKEFKKWF